MNSEERGEVSHRETLQLSWSQELSPVCGAVWGGVSVYLSSSPSIHKNEAPSCHPRTRVQGLYLCHRNPAP